MLPTKTRQRCFAGLDATPANDKRVNLSRGLRSVLGGHRSADDVLRRGSPESL
jgi:hypothetical protein